MDRIRFTDTFPQAHLARVKEILEAYEPFFPRDYEYLEVGYGESREDYAEAADFSENHWGRIKLFNLALALPDELLEQSVCHELAHLVSWTLDHEVEEIIETYLGEDAKWAAMARKQFHKLRERFVDGLAWKMMALRQHTAEATAQRYDEAYQASLDAAFSHDE